MDNKFFSRGLLLRYPNGMDPSKLRHVYVQNRETRAGRSIDFKRVVSLIDEVKLEVKKWYEKESGQTFNQYALGGMLDLVRKKFWGDSRFLDAVTLLGLDTTNVSLAYIPWWNEIAAAELNHELRDNKAIVTLGPRHSIETQFMRNGIIIPGIANVSVGGIIQTSDGYFVIGLRGGTNYPNTYHVNAGALRLTDGLKAGSESIFDVYKRWELLAEIGLFEEVLSAELLSRQVYPEADYDTMYAFLLKTRLTFEEVESRYCANNDEDKGEHTKLVAIKATPEEVMRFIRSHFRGRVANRIERKDDERYLLYQGAVALLALTNESIEALKSLCSSSEL